MLKLTKAQWKDRDRIDAWLTGQLFRENARSSPSVPQLSTEDVEAMYIPEDVQARGAYFTPIDMANELLSHVIIPSESKIIDPCAGIGNLLSPFSDFASCTAIELSQMDHQIGERIHPEYTWHHGDAFEYSETYKDTFDFVVMNPPFGITWGQMGADKFCKYAKKSEHAFFELAYRMVVPGGFICVIAPYNYFERMPKVMQDWISIIKEDLIDVGQLNGEFRLTKIRVHGFIFVPRKIRPSKDVEISQVSKEVLVPQPAQPVNVFPSASKPLSVLVPEAVADELNKWVKEGNAFPGSHKEAVARFKFRHFTTAAEWLRMNFLEYDSLYFHGWRTS